MIEVNEDVKKLALCRVWAGQPLLCYDPVDKKEVLAVVSVISTGELRIRDLAVKDRAWSVTGTVLSVRAKFDSWDEARDYFAKSLYAELAKEYMDIMDTEKEKKVNFKEEEKSEQKVNFKDIFGL